MVIGRTNTPEFSFRAFTDNPLRGLTRNPWAPEGVTCGGSSGGAAANRAVLKRRNANAGYRGRQAVDSTCNRS